MALERRCTVAHCFAIMQLHICSVCWQAASLATYSWLGCLLMVTKGFRLRGSCAMNTVRIKMVVLLSFLQGKKPYTSNRQNPEISTGCRFLRTSCFMLVRFARRRPWLNYSACFSRRPGRTTRITILCAANAFLNLRNAKKTTPFVPCHCKP